MTAVPPTPELSVDRTVHQVCTVDGMPYEGYATTNLWVTEGDPYPKTDGNTIEPFTTGQDYYKALAAAIAGAGRTVCMLGWQINWDVHLVPGLRLYDAILKAVTANTSLKVYVLPWDSSIGIDTGCKETEAVLNYINTQISGPPRVFVKRALEHPDSTAGFDNFFSHHQKQVVIDSKTAFMGGIDVCWGRRDDATYTLKADGREGNDAYNGCVPHVLAVDPKNYVDSLQVQEADNFNVNGTSLPNQEAIDAKAHLRTGRVQLPPGAKMLDAARQPRMPWQDLHLKIEGPAAIDLASNFVLRWNVANSKDLHLPLPPAATGKGPGSCSVQMLRSASDKMVELEGKSVTTAEHARVHDKCGHNTIYQAMVHLIEHAEHYIYIENQFFVSAFGHEGFGDQATGPKPEPSPEVQLSTSYFKKEATRRAWGDADAYPTNIIGEALGTKICNMILDTSHPSPDGRSSPFHVYITLPVHPEGMLNDPSTMTQVHFTMQSLVYGSQSLLNRIRRAIAARKLVDKMDTTYERVFNDGNVEYKSVPIEQCWPYVTLLNLRNWEQIGGRYVTEQIYVHNKTMIVDDCYAIVGSANINDRSQLGNRDSELAVLVVDTDFSYEDIGSKDGPSVTRAFARKLRMAIWNKIFGNTGGSRAAGLDDAIKRPAAETTWRAMRAVAAANSERYEEAFPFIPASGRSIWPSIRMDAKTGRRVSGLMPFDEAFWSNTAPQSPDARQLSAIRGYITLLPWQWTLVDGKVQNNNSGMHSALFGENELRDQKKAAPIELAFEASPSQAS